MKLIATALFSATIIFQTATTPAFAQRADVKQINGNIKNKVRLETELATPGTVEHLAFTSDGEWLLLRDGGGSAQSDAFPVIPGAGIVQYHSLGLDIEAIAINPDGGWALVVVDVLLTNDTGIWDPALFRSLVEGYISAGRTIVDIAFDGDGEGWVITTDDPAQSTARHVDNTLHKYLVDARRAGRVVNDVAMSATGKWVLIADNWYATEDAGGPLRTTLGNYVEPSDRLDHFEYINNAWVLVSRAPLAAVTQIEQVETSVADGAGGVTSIHNRMDQLGVRGVSIGFINGGVLAWARAYGVLEQGTESYARTDSKFAAESLSKGIAALGMVARVSKGDVTLDDDVTAIAPNFNGSTFWQWWVFADFVVSGMPVGVTPRTLLSHRAGMNQWGFAASGVAPGGSIPTLVEVLFSGGAGHTNCTGVVVQSTSMIVPVATPGSQTCYSGGGFEVSRSIIEAVSGSDFATTLAADVLGPLGMDDSTFAIPLTGSDKANSAVYHDNVGNPLTTVDAWTAALAAGGLWTTPTDYAKFVAAMLGNDPGGLFPDPANPGQSLIGNLTAIQSTSCTNNTNACNYGLGVQLSNSTTAFGHGGSGGIAVSGVTFGARTFYVANTATNQAIIIMTNAPSTIPGPAPGQTITGVGRTIVGNILAAFQTVYGGTWIQQNI